MNRIIWNILGVLTLLATLSILSIIPEKLATLPPEQHPRFMIGMLGLISVLVVIASICFFPKSRPLTLRILGLIGILGCIVNLVEGFRQGNFAQFPAVLLFWLPGSIYLVISGRMGDEPPLRK